MGQRETLQKLLGLVKEAEALASQIHVEGGRFEILVGEIRKMANRVELVKLPNATCGKTHMRRLMCLAPGVKMTGSALLLQHYAIESLLKQKMP